MENCKTCKIEITKGDFCEECESKYWELENNVDEARQERLYQEDYEGNKN